SAPILQRFVAKLTDKYASNTVMGVIAVIKNSLVVAQNTGVVEKQFSAAIQRPKATEKVMHFVCLKFIWTIRWT
ncbi:MAG: hypothetical protein ACI4MN_04020, partial [Candidatus Coproplasma sp.]